jgi:uncharacterized protein (TIGR03435 family)
MGLPSHTIPLETREVNKVKLRPMIWVGIIGVALGGLYWVVVRHTSMRFGHAPPPATSFEVAVIKASVLTGRGRVGVSLMPGGVVTASHVSLKSLIEYAYALKEFQVSGVVGWIDSELYDMTANTRKDTTPTVEQVRQMIQALLKDRFKLQFHQEMREISVYDLVVISKRSKLRESTRDAKFLSTFMPGKLTGSKITMAQLANQLSSFMGRPVLDKTRLIGTYDFTLEWTPEKGDASPLGRDDTPLPPVPKGPDILDAVRDQLGLELEISEALMQILDIDHAEKPKEN